MFAAGTMIRIVLLLLLTPVRAFSPSFSATINAYHRQHRAPVCENTFLHRCCWHLPRSDATTLRVAAVSEFSKVETKDTPLDDQRVDSVIVGAGPAGLLAAIMLAQKLPHKKVKVFDRLSAPPSPTDESVWSDIAKFYLIGLGSRGQMALAKYGVWESVKSVCTEVLGRKDWAPESGEEGIERIYTDRPVSTQVLPRDKLVGVLHQHILEKYANTIELNYGFEVTPVDFDGDTFVTVRVSKCDDDNAARRIPASLPSLELNEELCNVDRSFILTTSLLIAADGTSRTVANTMERDDRTKRKKMGVVEKLRAGKPFQVMRYVDDNPRVYKTIPIKMPQGWRTDLNYSARSKDGRIIFDTLPADRNGNYCGVLLVKKGDEFAAANTDPKALRTFMNNYLLQFSQLVDDETIAAVAKKPPSMLPSFRYASPRLNQGGRTVLLGDCAHTVKPYFGLGANSALEDVTVLADAIDATSSIPDAVHLFSNKRAGEAEALVKLSRELDRPGIWGFLTFVLPLILDSIFHGIAPKLFSPNVISMLQKQGIDFRGVRRRKRIDRLCQIVILSFLCTGIVVVSKVLVRALAKVTGKRGVTVVGSLIACVAGARLLRKALYSLNPSLAQTGVMNKVRDTITGSDTFLTPLGMKRNLNVND